MKYIVSAVALVAATVALSGVAVAQDKKIIGFVVNGPSDFWKLTEAGVATAQAELDGFELQFRYPEQAAAAVQQRVVDDLIAAGAAAVAVSPVDASSMTEAINGWAKSTALFTFDSDAPQSDRIAYFGSSNVELGKNAGELMKKALPNGGKCIGFVGLPGAANAVERLQGYNEAVAGTGLEITDVRGDDIDQTRARANVDDVLAGMPDVTCMVGFYSYNPPRIYEALAAAGKLGTITVVGFDEDPITLGAVKDGAFAGTVVQQPWSWGYDGSKLVANYLNGDKSGIPADGVIIIPGLSVTADNVEAFQADLAEKLSRLNK